MTTLDQLKKDLLADGVIDAAEVGRLKEILYADGVIDREEADFLFDINDAVSGKDNAPEWNEFFTRAICDFLLKDETSPGEIDADEEAWLIAKVNNDGQVDDAEKALLKAIKAEAKSFPAALEAMI